MKFKPEMNKIKKVTSKIFTKKNKLKINIKKEIIMKKIPIVPKYFIGEKIRKTLKIRYKNLNGSIKTLIFDTPSLLK